MIIGLDGYAGAGKDTVADIFTKMGFIKVAFADALREAASHSFGIELDYFLNRGLKDKAFEKPFILSPKDICDFCTHLGYEHRCDEVVLRFRYTEVVSPRHLLQFVATEIGRDTLSPTIWIDKYIERIPDSHRVVTPDARFDNERSLIKDLEGKVFWIERPGLAQIENHISGTDKWPIDRYDVVVYNDCSIGKLQHELGVWWTTKRESPWS